VDFIFLPFILTFTLTTQNQRHHLFHVSHPAKMRQHKVVARIFLFLSIANFTFAGVANTPTMHEMRVDLVTPAEDVTEASERGHTQSEELPEWLGRPSTAGHLHSRLDPPAQAVDPDENKFFSKELIRKMKEYFILGSIAGTFIGVGNAIQKEDFGTVSPGAYVFFYLSSLPPPANT
jgi:hypothetical protein